MIGRDHLDAGSVASPNRETEGMLDGSDAIADWPILNALLNTSSGATWVSVHHGGGVGIGYSLHAGMVVVADGSAEADEKLVARADVRPRDGRRAPRGCRLSSGDRGSRTRRHQTSRCGLIGRSAPRDRRAARPRAARAGVAGRCAHSRPARRLRHRTHVAAAAAGAVWIANRTQYLDMAAAATTPERCLAAIVAACPFKLRNGPLRPPADSPRAAFECAAGLVRRAVAPDGGPVTFLLDEFLDVRTFESFPGLRHVQRDLVARLAASPNRFRAGVALHRARTGCCAMPRRASKSCTCRRSTSTRSVACALRFDGGRRDWATPSPRRSRRSRAAAPPTRTSCSTCSRHGRRRPIRWPRLAALLASMGRSPRVPRSATSSGCTARAATARSRRSSACSPKTSRSISRKSRSGCSARQARRKDYLSWLEDVDLITCSGKRYAFEDPLLRLYVRLYGRPVPPTDARSGARSAAPTRKRACRARRHVRLPHRRSPSSHDDEDSSTSIRISEID